MATPQTEQYRKAFIQEDENLPGCVLLKRG